MDVKTSSGGPQPRKVALLVVDMQEDFCPPNGTLAVPGARDIVPTLNALLALPFALKLATRDHHPPGHISFASSHGPDAVPFQTMITIANPLNPAETYESLLWPDHCVRDTPGGAFLPELDVAKADRVVLKGVDPRVETYSAFGSPLRDPPLPEAVSGLAGWLREEGITDVVMGGLAGDYCVKYTSEDCAELGWATYVVEDGVRCVYGEEGWRRTREEMEEKGIKVVNSEWVRQNLFPGTDLR